MVLLVVGGFVCLLMLVVGCWALLLWVGFSGLFCCCLYLVCVAVCWLFLLVGFGLWFVVILWVVWFRLVEFGFERLFGICDSILVFGFGFVG